MVVDHMMNVLPLRPRYPQQKTPDLAAFVTTVVQRSQATLVMVIVALIYVDRMKRGLPARSVGGTPLFFPFPVRWLCSMLILKKIFPTGRFRHATSTLLCRLDARKQVPQRPVVHKPRMEQGQQSALPHRRGQHDGAGLP